MPSLATPDSPSPGTPSPDTPAALRAASRWTGALLVAMTVCAIYAEVAVRQSLVVPGDAAATAAALRGAPVSVLLAVMGYAAAYMLDVPVSVLLHRVFGRGAPLLSLISTAFRLVYTAIVATALLGFVAAAALVQPGATAQAHVALDLEGAALEQAIALGMAAFDVGFQYALTFFGVHLVLLAVVMWRAGLSRVGRGLAVAVGLGGLSYTLGGALLLLAPGVHAALAPVLNALGMAELGLAFWLLAGGPGRRV